MKSTSIMIRLAFVATLVCSLSGCVAAVVGGAAASAGHDRRSFWTVMDDANIELSAQEQINKDKELALKNNVKVIVYNGTLLVIGEVRTQELRDRATALVTGFKDVRRVVNEIVVTEPRGFWKGSKDRYLTARVKTGLLDIVDMPDFDPTRVNVTTQNGVVYLMGLVTHEEGERVTQVARDVPGVVRVVKVFEYDE
jgi:osmotically-inducible protein OsmY